MIYLSPEVNDKIGQGIDYAVNAVKPTIGPLGRNIAFDPKMDVPYVINSGKEIVKHINFEDKALMVGVDVVKQAMEKAFWTAGDGAVATAIMVQNIWNEALKLDAAGADSMALMRGVRKASEVAVEYLKANSDKISSKEDVKALALCAAGGRPDIANIITEIYDRIGPNGYVTIEDSQMAETRINYFKGVKWSKGYIGHYEEESITLENPIIVLVNYVASKFEDFAPILRYARDKGRSVLIIAREIKDDLANAFHYVRDNAGVDLMAVTAPGYGDVRNSNMRYFSIMFGATVFDDMMLDVAPNITPETCGSAGKVVINKKETIIQDIPNPDDPIIDARRRELYNDLDNIKSEDDRYRIEQMLTPLAGDTAEVFVGGVMEMEMFERKYLVDNAVHNTYGAVRSGYLPGAGKGYMLAIPAVEEFANEKLSGDEQLGARILANALCAPAWQICENAGLDAKACVEHMKSSKEKYEGINVLTDKFEDLHNGVLDCSAVVCSAIATAVSSVSTAISVAACVVAVDPNEEEM